MARSLLACTATLMVLLAFANAQEWKAVSYLQTSVGYSVSGTILLTQYDCSAPVLINGTITGLKPGFHGFHLHQFGDVSDSCKFCGPHFNLLGVDHGGPTSGTRHTGDFGNLEADASGTAVFNLSFNGISLCTGNKNSVLGRSLVVHALQDDHGTGAPGSQTKLTGNSGARVACGVIGLLVEPLAPCPPCPCCP